MLVALYNHDGRFERQIRIVFIGARLVVNGIKYHCMALVGREAAIYRRVE